MDSEAASRHGRLLLRGHKWHFHAVICGFDRVDDVLQLEWVPVSALQAKSWQHDELARDLAASLSCEGRMVWTDIQLGPQGSPRPDVFRIDKSFAHPMAMAYECKISRSDFLADVTVGKWRSYLAYAYAVVFAVPDGLVSKSEVPDMCGLIVRKESAWRMAILRIGTHWARGRQARPRLHWR